MNEKRENNYHCVINHRNQAFGKKIIIDHLEIINQMETIKKN